MTVWLRQRCPTGSGSLRIVPTSVFPQSDGQVCDHVCCSGVRPPPRDKAEQIRHSNCTSFSMDVSKHAVDPSKPRTASRELPPNEIGGNHSTTVGQAHLSERIVLSRHSDLVDDIWDLVTHSVNDTNARLQIKILHFEL